MALAVAAMLAVAGTAAAGTGAAKAPVFALQPITSGPYYTFQAHPGQTVSGRVRVVNTGSAAGTARIYAVDATTGATSGAIYLTDSIRRTDVGAWTRMSVGQVHLRPGQARIVGFTMRVPKGARSGDHLGGIVADPGVQRGRAVRRSRSSFRINVRTLTVIAVEAQLPGKRVPGMAITGVSAGGMRGYQQLFLDLRNAGNVLVKGSGSVVVESMGGLPLKASRFSLDTFVPQTQIGFPVLIHGKALPSGTYRAAVTVHYAGRTVTGTFTFKIGKRELAQVFGSKATGNPGVSGNPLALMIAAGVTFLLVGFVAAAVVFKRRERRIAARLRDLDELEMWRLQAAAAAEPVAAVTHDDSQNRLDS